MSNPVVVTLPSGSYDADRAAIEWLWEMLDAHALPETHAALGRALHGENLELPEAELDGFGQALGQILSQLDPASPHEPALTELAQRLAAG